MINPTSTIDRRAPTSFLFMEEVVGTAPWSEIYVIIEKLSTNLCQMPTHIRDFCREVCEYPDEALREELTEMVREARLREIVRLESDLPNITPHNYFERIEYWLRDIGEDEVYDCVNSWADRAAELSGACQIASRAVERASSEWTLIKRWINNVGTKPKLREGNSSVESWSIWWLNSREDVMPSTTALDVRLEVILRSTRDLRETIERLGRFWDEFSSNIKAVPPSMMLDYRALIISSGRGRDMIKQWAVVSDLIRKFGIDRWKAVGLVRLAPPAIRSTAWDYGGQVYETRGTPILPSSFLNLHVANELLIASTVEKGFSFNDHMQEKSTSAHYEPRRPAGSCGARVLIPV
ncbi:hypothetical protein FRC05_011633 [Tulasnella sp. 425]|nr:hypothetical protein FRC05_011633 [Tulasnella sp. 425]